MRDYTKERIEAVRKTIPSSYTEEEKDEITRLVMDFSEIYVDTFFKN